MKLTVTKLAHLSGHQNSIYALGANNQNSIFTGATDGFIVSWNKLFPETGKLLVKVNRPVYSFLFWPERNLLFAGTAQGNLHVIDLALQQEIKNIEAHANGLFDIKFFNRFIVTCGGDGAVCIWDDSFKLLHKLIYTSKNARVIAVHPDKNSFAVGYSDNFIRVFNNSFKLIETLQQHVNSVFALAYSNDGSLLLSGSRDAHIAVSDVQNNYKLIQKIPAHTLHVNSIAFNTDGSLFASVSMDKTIKIWETKTQTLLKVIDFARNKSHTNSVNKVLWLSNNQFVTCSDDKTAMIWEIGII
jgi:WD40 repeat protein